MDTSTLQNHFVCSECGGVSHQSGTCQTDDCQQQGLPLKVCHCENSKHEGVLNPWKQESKDITEDPDSNTNVKTIDLDA